MLLVGVRDPTLSAPYLAIPPSPKFWLPYVASPPGWHLEHPAPSHTHTHTHARVHQCTRPEQRERLNMCCEADSVLFRVNRSDLNPSQISLTLLCGEIIWGRFKIHSAFIYTFIYGTFAKKMQAFNWTDLVIWFGGRLGSELSPGLFTR